MKKLLLIISILALYTTSVYAQDAGQNLSRIEEEIFEQQKEEQIKQMQQSFEQNKKIQDEDYLTEEQKKDNKENDKKTLKIDTIYFSSTAVLEQSFLDNIKKQYEGKLLSVNDIYAIVNTINNEYILKGFIASRAYLPEQDVSNGTLVISLVEGRINNTNILNNEHTSTSYINRYISFCKGSLIEVNSLQQGALEFNAANDAKARLSLQPGSTYGTTDVNVVIDEPQTISFTGFMDNAGQKETGRLRYGAYGILRSLTKYRDILYFGGMLSQGSKNVFASYEIPEPFLNTRVGITFDYSDTEIVNGSLEPLNITGDFYGFSLYAKKPFWVKLDSVSNFKFTIATRNGANYISSAKTQTNKVDTLSLSLDNIKMFNKGYLFNMLSATQGLTLLNGNSYFTKANYYGEGHYNLSKYFGLNLKLKGQLKVAGEIPSSEQMQIGGVNTVKGYNEGLISSDNGLNAMFEFQYNMNFLKKYDFIDYTQSFAFFDYGRIFPSSNIFRPESYTKDLYSVGVGLRLGVWKHFEGNVALAQTLKARSSEENKETKVLFYVQAKI